MMASEGDKKLGNDEICVYLAHIDTRMILRGRIAELLRNSYISRPGTSKHAHLPNFYFIYLKFQYELTTSPLK